MFIIFFKTQLLKLLIKYQEEGRRFLSFAIWLILTNYGSINTIKGTMDHLWTNFSLIFSDLRTKSGVFLKEKLLMFYINRLAPAEKPSSRLLTPKRTMLVKSLCRWKEEEKCYYLPACSFSPSTSSLSLLVSSSLGG